MQMFIAVINENFDVAEEAKKGRQASHYWASQRQEKTHTSWMKKFNPYRWFAPAPKAIAVDNLPSSLVLPMQKALVQDYSAPKRELSAKVHPILSRS
jgi:voltage-dependent calcium channel